MSLLRYLIGTFLILIFAVLGASAALALPSDWARVSHSAAAQHVTTQSPNLAFAARAPPQTGDSVAIAGASSAGAGDVHALYDVASLGLGELPAFSGSSIAPNRAADDVFETGANITPNSTLDRYSHIGADGTFVTEVSSIENVIGRIPSNATEIRITRQQAAQLETDLGLNPGSLEANNTLSLVDDIAGRCPRCPIGGNDQFLGGGQGLPGGGSELAIDSIPSSGGNGVRQIMVIVE